MSKFFPVPPPPPPPAWGKCYISDLEKKIGRSADNGGGAALKRLIFANLSQKTSGGF